MSIIIEPGLIFCIPLSGEKFGFGQLIAWQKPIFYLVAFDLQSDSESITEAALQRGKPML